MSITKLRGLILAAWLAGLTTTSLAQLGSDPAPMYGLNPANTNVSPCVGISRNPRILWQISHEQPSIDCPALVLDSRGVLYSPDHAPVWAATGQSVSNLTMQFLHDGTPVIDRLGNIYHWEMGRFHAYRADGTAMWTGGATNCSDGTTPTMGFDGTIYAQDVGSVLHVYSPGGTEKWTALGGWSAPAAIDTYGNVYLTREGITKHYISYDSNGTLRWSAPGAQSGGGFGRTTLGPDGNLYSSEGNTVYVRDPATGNILRQHPTIYGGIQAIGADGTIYAGSYHTVQATDLYGAIKWKATVSADIYIQDLVVDAIGKVFCTTEENQIMAFSNTGTQLWSLQLPATGWQTLPPIIGPDGTIYLLNGGRLMAIVPEPATLAILACGAVAMLRLRRRARA